jgi:cyanate permease
MVTDKFTSQTLFSTCFVELRSPGTGLVVHREIWVAALTVLALIGGNSLLLWVWDHRGKKSQRQVNAKVKV